MINLQTEISADQDALKLRLPQLDIYSHPTLFELRCLKAEISSSGYLRFLKVEVSPNEDLFELRFLKLEIPPTWDSFRLGSLQIEASSIRYFFNVRVLETQTEMSSNWGFFNLRLLEIRVSSTRCFFSLRFLVYEPSSNWGFVKRICFLNWVQFWKNAISSSWEFLKPRVPQMETAWKWDLSKFEFFFVFQTDTSQTQDVLDFRLLLNGALPKLRCLRHEVSSA